MALRLEDKKQLVKEVNAVAGDSVTAVAAEYRGLSVAEMTELRKEARNAARRDDCTDVQTGTHVGRTFWNACTHIECARQSGSGLIRIENIP